MSKPGPSKPPTATRSDSRNSGSTQPNNPHHRPSVSTINKQPIYTARKSRGTLLNPEVEMGLTPSVRAVNTRASISGRKSVSQSRDRPRSSKDENKDLTPEEEKACNQTIVIPPTLPDILKAYAKAAMRTQPPDLLRWSGAYFRALANGEPLPVKDKVEYPGKESADGLTPGILRVIDLQLGNKSGQSVPKDTILKRWRGFGLSVDSFNGVLTKAKMNDANNLDWDKILAVMASTIGKNLADTMEVICDVLTLEPEGTEPLINYSLWLGLYNFLGVQVQGNVTPQMVENVNAKLSEASKKRNGMIGPNDFTKGDVQLE